MYTRVMIVDDELLARNQLCAMIDWEEYGYVLCGEAEDGLKALELIKELQPHIVLIDINMPLMDGVALCQYVSEHYKAVSTIILSNFDNFDYVRDTLNSGAVDYLLKHRLDPESLLDVLERASNKLGKSPNTENTHDSAGKLEERKASTADLESVIQQLAQSDGSALMDEAAAAILKPYTKNTVVLVMQMLHNVMLAEKHIGEDRSMFIRSILELCRQLIGDVHKGCVAYTGHGSLVFILSYPEYRSETPILQSIQTFADKVSQTLQMIYTVSVAFGHSPVCHQIDKLPSYYRHACDAMDRKITHLQSEPVVRAPGTGGGGTGFAAASPAGYNSNHANSIGSTPMMALTIRQEKELLASILICNTSQIDAIIDEVFIAFTARSSGFPQLTFLIEEMINLAHRVGKKIGADVHWISVTTDSSLPKSSHLPEIQIWIKALYHRLVEDIKRLQTQGKYSKNVEEAMKLIHEHYLQGITLEEAAVTIGITPSYLSRIFKEETGRSFTESINHFKIELSKQYIENGNQKFKEMYSRIGFNNYSYFFKVFKDIVGETPHSYAKKYLKNK
ncbi:response regulator transcription factor [Paenibacillus qinlingensis]|uniref:response regulator transcription factor n=1 Tax=Paenibacillus qinlingensis TaxID=1837343 RepID=UPI0015671ED0|nr:response regulator [Paenibacillus qinlingensis]